MYSTTFAASMNLQVLYRQYFTNIKHLHEMGIHRIIYDYPCHAYLEATSFNVNDPVCKKLGKGEEEYME